MGTRVSPLQRHSSWTALACAVLAFASLQKFPGLSGMLGRAGWIVIAYLVYRHPALLAAGEKPWRQWRGPLIALGAALLLVIGSVVIWSLGR